MDQEDGAMNKHNTASMQNGKKRPSFSILPEKPDGAEDWFYTFMCMNIPFYGWRYLKQLVYQEPNDSPKSQFARAYLYYLSLIHISEPTRH